MKNQLDRLSIQDEAASTLQLISYLEDRGRSLFALLEVCSKAKSDSPYLPGVLEHLAQEVREVRQRIALIFAKDGNLSHVLDAIEEQAAQELQNLADDNALADLPSHLNFAPGARGS